MAIQGKSLRRSFSCCTGNFPNIMSSAVILKLHQGQILYLQPKREKAEAGKEFYNTAEGDTMYLISQRYGIKLKSLYKMNRMQEDSDTATGKYDLAQKYQACQLTGIVYSFILNPLRNSTVFILFLPSSCRLTTLINPSLQAILMKCFPSVIISP